MEASFNRPAPEIDLAHLPGGRDLYQFLVSADHAATLHVLDGRASGPARNATAHTADVESQMRRGKKTLLEMHGQTIAGNNVKARAGQQHDLCAFGVIIQFGERFEARDLAADVQVVTARDQAGFCHLLEGVHERTGAMQNALYIAQGGIEGRCVVERKGAVFEIQGFGLGVQARLISPGQDGFESLLDGEVRDQLSGVAIRAVNEECFHKNIIALIMPM